MYEGPVYPVSYSVHFDDLYTNFKVKKIRISKEKLEGYKPIVDEFPLSGKGELDRIEEREECIARVYIEKTIDDTRERLDTLESAVMELGELVSSMEGESVNGEVISQKNQNRRNNDY